MTPLDTLREVIASIRTAQSIVHHQLYALGDQEHNGIPGDCTRPACRRLLDDARTLERIAGEMT